MPILPAALRALARARLAFEAVSTVVYAGVFIGAGILELEKRRADLAPLKELEDAKPDPTSPEKSKQS